MSLGQIYQNIIWRVEAITPSFTISPSKFRHNDQPLHMTDEQALKERMFSVEWDRGDPVTDFSDLNDRWSPQFFIFEISYDASRDLDKYHELMFSDRDQIHSAMRNPDNFMGYNDDNSTADIGIKGRWLDSEEQDSDRETMRIMRQIYRLTVSETD
tara:strand:- start:134 stop:601 length:468 start_codon:yes stop_codon:yes gene_type:complete